MTLLGMLSRGSITRRDYRQQARLAVLGPGNADHPRDRRTLARQLRNARKRDAPVTDVMAVLRWNFDYLGVRIAGSHEMRSATDAVKLRDRMNDEHGDGSHWVETLNWTWDERPNRLPDVGVLSPLGPGSHSGDANN